MNLRKMLALTVASVTIMSSLSSVFADYGTYDDAGNYTPPRKIQKLMKLETKLDAYLDKQILTRVQSIDDKQLKRFYLYEIGLKKEKLKQYFENLSYAYSDEEFPQEIQKLRSIVTELRDVIVEAEKSHIAGVNPFIISDTDRTRIENNILAGQKDIIAYVRSIIQMYEDKDMKQSNPSVLHFE